LKEKRLNFIVSTKQWLNRFVSTQKKPLRGYKNPIRGLIPATLKNPFSWLSPKDV
jgi:hypothetical protein